MAVVRSFIRSIAFLAFSTQGLIFANGLQRFDKQPQYTEVNPGEDVKLTCTIFNKKGTCSWQKNNKPVGIYKDKYEWAGSQESGDCSLLIRHVTIDFDDGEWECQVTASEFTAQDALTSTPVRLVVRVAPQWPRIEVNSTTVSPGNNISSDVGKTITVKCLSRYGNPPARLKWFLGDKELLVGSKQSNAPEMDNNRTWVATSLLDIVYTKDLYGRTLRCVALHKSYPKESQEVQVRLDVKYAPEVRLEGIPTVDLEEGKDTVVLRCIVDSNPPSVVRWKLGEQRIVSTMDILQFRPVKRRDSGSYYCEAENSVGTSVPLSVVVDVKYPPRIRKVGPTRLTTAPLYSDATFSCEAEGNPLPKYQWLQKVPAAADTLFTRGSEAKLRIANITYDYQGEYICKVSNTIGGIERIVDSEPITIQVVGAPQVLRHAGTREVLAVRGEEALLRLIVCADPRPRRAIWEWGSEFVETGKPNGRYQAELIEDEREDCYEARLHVQDVEPSDSRSYYLAVENERGSDRHAVHLTVREPMWTTTLLSMMHHEPVPMTTLLSIAAGCLLIFLFCVFVAIYVVRREKCCFANAANPNYQVRAPPPQETQGRNEHTFQFPTGGGLLALARYSRFLTQCQGDYSAYSLLPVNEIQGRGDFRPTDLESEKSDLNSEIGRKQPPSVIVGTGAGTIPTETMYNSSPGRRPHTITAHSGGSPEAMKRRDGSSTRKRRKSQPEESQQEKSPTPTVLPLDYHNVNKHRRKTGKSDFKVRGSVGHYYYYYKPPDDEGETTATPPEVRASHRSLSKAIVGLKSSNGGSRDEFRDRILPSDEPDHFDNSQRTLDHSITQKLFDDMGNIAGRNDNRVDYFGNQGTDYSNFDGYGKIENGGHEDILDQNGYESEYPYEDGKYYKSNRRVAPIYMANPYQPDSLNRAEI